KFAQIVNPKLRSGTSPSDHSVKAERVPLNFIRVPRLSLAMQGTRVYHSQSPWAPARTTYILVLADTASFLTAPPLPHIAPSHSPPRDPSSLPPMVDVNGDITAPLLDVGPPEVALDVNRFLDRGSEAAGPPPENPFEFLGATPLALPPMNPVDPFRNHTPHIAGLYEWCKTVLCLPIAAARLVLLGIAIAVGYVTTLVALYGWKDKETPMSRWRSRVMCVTRLCARFILFSFG
ncbi:hypothetical protein BHM03_00005649, partial [Ensete ventricosum]